MCENQHWAFFPQFHIHCCKNTQFSEWRTQKAQNQNCKSESYENAVKLTKYQIFIQAIDKLILPPSRRDSKAIFAENSNGKYAQLFRSHELICIVNNLISIYHRFLYICIN